MHIAAIKRPDGTTREVKNLGWILRNWRGIERLEWVDVQGRFTFHGKVLLADGIMDGVFRAYMRDGTVYATTYASFEVWKGFINRPVFRSLPVTVNGITGTV